MRTEIKGNKTTIKDINVHEIHIGIKCKRCGSLGAVTLEEFAFSCGHFQCDRCEEDGYDDCEMVAYVLRAYTD